MVEADIAKLPSFQFYPGDWRKDPGVQALTYHDRGVWFEILCMMFESEQRGKLLLNGKPISDDALARLLGLGPQVLTNTLTTLLDFGVASRDPQTGALICRRMVRDEDVRVKRAEGGKLGGNPVLRTGKDNLEVNLTPNLRDNLIPEDEVEREAEKPPKEKEPEEPPPPAVNPSMKPAYEKELSYHADARSVLHYLNEATGRPFRECDSNLAPITARMREHNATFADVKVMIDRQCRSWKGGQFEEHLCPSTLFRPSNFERYYTARNMPIRDENNRPANNQRPNRNIGTLNEGNHTKYAVLKRPVGTVAGTGNVQ